MSRNCLTMFFNATQLQLHSCEPKLPVLANSTKIHLILQSGLYGFFPLSFFPSLPIPNSSPKMPIFPLNYSSDPSCLPVSVITTCPRHHHLFPGVLLPLHSSICPYSLHSTPIWSSYQIMHFQNADLVRPPSCLTSSNSFLCFKDLGRIYSHGLQSLQCLAFNHSSASFLSMTVTGNFLHQILSCGQDLSLLYPLLRILCPIPLT